MRSSKYVRQQLMHEFVMDKICDQGLRVDTPELLHQLGVTGSMVTGLNHRLVETLRNVMVRNDIQGLGEILSGDGETEGELRNLSPLSCLLTEDERVSLIRKSLSVERDMLPA